MTGNVVVTEDVSRKNSRTFKTSDVVCRGAVKGPIGPKGVELQAQVSCQSPFDSAQGEWRSSLQWGCYSRAVGYHREQGFSLTELIIVVAIIGILAGIVYPSYRQYMYETRRSDAWVALSAAAAAQERWYSINHAYTDEISNLGGSSSPEGYYSISAVADGSSFTLKATALSTFAQSSDSGCTLITLDHLGVQSPGQCWK